MQYTPSVLVLLLSCGLRCVSAERHPGESLFLPDERTTLDDCQLRYYQYFGASGGGIGGMPARLFEFAHMGAIGWTQPDGQVEFKCGGSLIWDNFVLTAAHCAVDDANLKPDVVRFGDLDIMSAEGDEYAQQVKIVEIIRHPEHRFLAHYHDIALLRLERNVTINKAVVPACLWTDMEVRFKRMDAIGWGTVGFGNKQSPELLKMTLSPISQSECEEVFNNETIRKLNIGLQSQHICAKDSKADTCEGDSGGPLQVKLMHNIRESPFIVGITSFGLPCSISNPGVYTRVAPYVSWIISTLQERGAAVDEQTFNATVCAHRYAELRDFYDAIVTTRNGTESEIDVSLRHFYKQPKLPGFIAKLDWMLPGTRDDCYGVIIDEETVLTVAECAEFEGKRVRRIVHPGTIDISSVHIHPRHKKGSTYYNIAILKLESLIKFEFGAPICIWHGYELPHTGIDSVGFGRTDLVEELFEGDSLKIDPTITNLVSKITVQNEPNCIIPEAFQPKLKHHLAHEHVCAGNGFFLVPEVCNMPLGLPLYGGIHFQSNSYTHVFALVQYSRDCGYGEHVIATRLSSHVEWMKSVLLPNYQDTSDILQFLDSDQTVGDSCQLSTGHEGRCVPLQECFSSAHKSTNLRDQRFCSSTSVICCPLEAPKGNELNSQHSVLQDCPSVVRKLEPVYGKGQLVIFGWDVNGSYRYRCFGSIITTQVVVTTASCLGPNMPKMVGHIISAPNNTFFVDAVVVHDSYNATDGSYDIALVKIRGSFVWSQKLYPACLWTNKTHTPLVMNMTHISRQNMLADQVILPQYNSDCQRVHSTRLQRSQLCGKQPGGGESVCRNPSDPLTWNDEHGVTHLVGMALHEEHCAKWGYGTFTRISPLVDWIQQMLARW